LHVEAKFWAHIWGNKLFTPEKLATRALKPNGLSNSKRGEKCHTGV